MFNFDLFKESMCVCVCVRKSVHQELKDSLSLLSCVLTVFSLNKQNVDAGFCLFPGGMAGIFPLVWERVSIRSEWVSSVDVLAACCS